VIAVLNFTNKLSPQLKTTIFTLKISSLSLFMTTPSRPTIGLFTSPTHARPDLLTSYTLSEVTMETSNQQGSGAPMTSDVRLFQQNAAAEY